MSRNGSGTHSIPNSFTNGTTADADEVNANFTDISAEITNSIAADGQTTITANIPMNSKKFTGLTSGSAATDSANLGQIQAQAWKWCGTAGGTADALTLSPSPAITAYAAGQSFRFIAGASPNTGATTVAVSGLTTKAIQNNGSALAAGDIAAGKMYEATYDGTQFQLGQVISAPLTSGDIGVTVQGYDADTLKADVSDTLTVGMLGSSYNLGNLNSATTLSISNGNIQHATMTGSFTLTAPNDTDDGYIELEFTIDGTGGYTLTLSGFNEVSGTAVMDASTVNILRISKLNTNTYLEIIQAV